MALRSQRLIGRTCLILVFCPSFADTPFLAVIDCHVIMDRVDRAAAAAARAEKDGTKRRALAHLVKQRREGVHSDAVQLAKRKVVFFCPCFKVSDNART